MNKILTSVVFFIVFSLGFAASSQASPMVHNGLKTYDTSKLIGLTVKARDGVQLGQIFDLVADSNGRLDFAIVSQVYPPNLEDPWPGHIVAVPFSALTISKTKSQEPMVVFNADKEKFYEAPDASSSFFRSGDKVNLAKITEVDRYFGVQPYWTEAAGKTTCDK